MLNHVKFAHLPVRDQDRALAFYRDKVGLKVATDAPYRDHLRRYRVAVGCATHALFTERRRQAWRDAERNSDHSRRRGRPMNGSTERGRLTAQCTLDAGRYLALFRDSENSIIMLGTQIAKPNSQYS